MYDFLQDDGRMTCRFTALSIVFQSHQVDRRMVMKGSSEF